MLRFLEVETDVGAEVFVLEFDLPRSLHGTLQCFLPRFAVAAHGNHASAVGDELAVSQCGSRMEDHAAFHSAFVMG